MRREEVRARLALHPELAASTLAHFVADAVAGAGAAGVVVGLSGGVDSALAAALAVRALGAERVHALYLPYRSSSEQSRSDARAVARVFGLALREIDISPQIDAYFDREEPDADATRRGNKMARERMTILFDQSKKSGTLVLGTSNKTELLLGYSTVFGDNASSLNPVSKAATADLWPGQTDEGDLGFDYPTADEILFLLFDQGYLPDEVVAAGYPEATVSRIVALEKANRFKRRMMLIARLSGSAVNLDREIPRD